MPTPCPLCGDSKHMKKGKPLYEKLVCKKCYYKFINRRQGAYLIDIFLWQFITYFLGFAFGFVIVTMVPDSTPGTIFLSGTVFGYFLFLFFACKDGFAGQSVGKMLTGVQVIDEESRQPAGFRASFKRNLCIAVPFVVFIIAFQLHRGKRLGDRWAKTRVVWKKYRNHPVFTGEPLPMENDEFLPGDGRFVDSDDNPFAPPRA